VDLARDHGGAWSGTNAFRLQPGDPAHEAPASLVVVDGGVLTALRYTWEHPDDGPQRGLLAVGAGPEPGRVVGLWGDTWHQAPGPTTVEGEVADGVVSVGYDYVPGAWAWRISLDLARAGELGLRMDNVALPDAGEGAETSWAMAATLHPAPVQPSRSGRSV